MIHLVLKIATQNANALRSQSESSLLVILYKQSVNISRKIEASFRASYLNLRIPIWSFELLCQIFFHMLENTAFIVCDISLFV